MLQLWLLAAMHSQQLAPLKCLLPAPINSNEFVTLYFIMSGKPASPSASTSSVESDGHLWDVAEILAERTTVSGDLELLVVWKTSWIPKANMIADGPVLRRFEAERKCSFTAGKNAMRITLPVQPGTSLAADCDDLDHRSHCKRNIARLDAAAATSSAKIKHDDAAEAEPHTKTSTTGKQ